MMYMHSIRNKGKRLQMERLRCLDRLPDSGTAENSYRVAWLWGYPPHVNTAKAAT